MRANSLIEDISAVFQRGKYGGSACNGATAPELTLIVPR